MSSSPSTTPYGPTLNLVNFNIVTALLGGFVLLFGLISYLAKEKLFLSESLVALIFGVIVSTHATNFVTPLDYTGTQLRLDHATLYFTRLVLGVQLVLAGVQLPSRYLKKEWRSLLLLLGPGMVTMWLVGSFICWILVPDLPFLHALAIAACFTPTDPVLSASIVKGRFADAHIPPHLQKLIVAESGANDGLGYPFLFFALYLIKFLEPGQGGAGEAIGVWVVEGLLYVVVLSVAYGAVVGWIAKDLLHWAEEKKFVDRESFLVFAIALALFIIGTCGMIGSDDVLACFIAGNVFTWDDWFRLETEDDSLQPTIDMLLNLTIFAWFGAICPWTSFGTSPYITWPRLVGIGILVLLFRRLPIVYTLHHYIHQIEEKKQAIFVGFFGPIGVSAVFYIYISLEFLETLTVDGVQRENARVLGEQLTTVVWFMTITSIVVHGLTIPLGKATLYVPRRISSMRSSPNASTFQIGESVTLPTPSNLYGALRERRRNRSGANSPSREGGEELGDVKKGNEREAVGREEDVEAVRARRAAREREREGGGEGRDAEREGEAEAERKVYRIGGSLIPSRRQGEGESREASRARERVITFPDE